MGMPVSDEELLIQQDAGSFEEFYTRYFERLLRFFSQRTRDAELAADLTAETFAAALVGRRRYRRRRGRPDSWLFGSPTTSLRMRGGVVTPRIGRVDAWASSARSLRTTTSRASTGWGWRTGRGTGRRAPMDQRKAIQAHVIDERSYGEIAFELQTSEAVVRKRVSRGLGAMRKRLGGRLF